MSNSFDGFDPQEKIKELQDQIERLIAMLENLECPFCHYKLEPRDDIGENE